MSLQVKYMGEQLKLDDFQLPEAVARGQDDPDYTPEAKVICSVCGLAMKNMGPVQTGYDRDYDDEIGVWKYSCRGGGHGGADLLLREGGKVELHCSDGKEHEIVDTQLEVVEGVGFAYPEYKDPTMWEEPEE